MRYESSDQRRRDAVAIGCQGLARDLLSDACPSEHDLVLVLIAVVDAGLAGDRDLLEAIPELTARLERYLPAAEWSEHWAGRLWALAAVSDMARVLLEVEKRVTARGD